MPLPEVGAPLQELRDDAIELLVRVGKARKIAFLHDRRGEARLGKDHHAGGTLYKMCAGARSHHQEEGILDLPMQPHDAGKAAEHFALTAFLQDGCIGAALRRGSHICL